MSTVATLKNGKSKTTSHLLEDDGVSTRDEFPTEMDLAPAASKAAKPPKRPRRRFAVIGILAAFLTIGATAGILYWLHAQQYESTDDATVEGRVITISPQISARVKSVHVSDNALVHKGDLLVELDDTSYQVALEQARGSESAVAGRLKEAQAKVDSAKASRDETKAEIAVADANAQMAESDHDRYVEASTHNGAISKQQLDNATATWRSTEAQVVQARAKLAAAEAQITTAQAAVEGAAGDLVKAQADVHRAEVDLTYCSLHAPEDGRITKKNVEPGSYVQTGQNLFGIVPQDFWVVANFKETQLDRLRPGQPVKISIDAYPEKDFTGRVES
ncbi:MAG TPA: HlyD family secretion protein, partial [Tepidisphaeraceae bacterium]|nr:HlyD family secretion protein [Tepidisphaeraceae bacterium]